MKQTIFATIYVKVSILIVIFTIILSAYVSVDLRNSFANQSTVELQKRLELVETFFNDEVLTDEKSIRNLCSALGKVTDSRISVFNQDGTIIADSEDDYHVDFRIQSELKRALNGGKTQDYHYSDNSKTITLHAVEMLEWGDGSSSGMLLRIESVEEGFSAKRNRLILRTALLGMLMLLAGMGIASYIARQITNPVKQINKAVCRYEQGDFLIKSRVENPAEIRDLSKHVDTMALSVSRKFDAVNTQKNKLETVLAHMVEPVILLDSDLVLREINPSAAKLFRIDPLHTLGHSLIEIIRNVDLFDLAKNALTKVEIAKSNISLYSNDEEFVLRVYAAPLPLLQDETGVLLVMNNITKMIKLEKMRREFVANVSHELKTPITSIKGFVELLNNDSGKPHSHERVKQFYSIITKHTDRMNVIINDLLSLSQLEQMESRQLSDAVYCNLADVVENSISLCSAITESESIHLEKRLDDSLHCTVNAFLVEQAVSNLLDNAAKYSGKNGTIVISCRRGATPGTAEIQVQDSGCGIPDEDSERIFNRFYRVDKARSRELGGSGLGLSIVKHIMLAHRGKVSVESQLGEGSKFTLIFSDCQVENTALTDE